MDPEHERPPRTSNAEVFARIYKVEGELGEVREALAGINVNLQSQATLLQRISISQEEKSSTDWKALASWSSVILAIVALFSTLAFSPIKERLNSQEITIGRMQEQRNVDQQNSIQQAEDRGAQAERVKSLATQIEIIREMNRRGP